MFSHTLFWNAPLSTLCFFALAMSFISLWVRKTPWLWGSFLLISYILAFQAKIASSLSLIPLATLLICHYFLKSEIKKGGRFVLFGIATAISVGLVLHLLPGFDNWRIFSATPISPNAYPYSLWFNYDKPFIGIFVLALSLPLISTRAQWAKIFKISLPMSVGAIAIVIMCALKMGIVKWDPKIPIFVFVWGFQNLLFVTIPEEGFFRGFIQNELCKWFGKTGLASCSSILVTALFSMLIHMTWAPSYSFLALIFIANILYGTLYQITKTIESSILCHFGLNLVHLLFFTYPALTHLRPEF